MHVFMDCWYLRSSQYINDCLALKIMRILGIHNFTLCHHLSFVAHFRALYAPCQIKRTSFLSSVLTLSGCCAGCLPFSLWSLWFYKQSLNLSCSSAGVITRNQRQCLTKTSNRFSTRNTFLYQNISSTSFWWRLYGWICQEIRSFILKFDL